MQADACNFELKIQNRSFMHLHPAHGSISDYIFIDIETVPAYRSFDLLPDRMKPLWVKREKRQHPGAAYDGAHYDEMAGIPAEFNKVICISMGFVHYPQGPDRPVARIKSFYGDDEKQLLSEFAAVLSPIQPRQKVLAGHNILEFDIPVLCRRCFVHGLLPLPRLLFDPAQKNYEVAHLDTMAAWKFGDYKSYTSLDLLTALFDIPSPKTNLSGDQVRDVYYDEENGLQRIVAYCEEDVLACMRLLCKANLLPLPNREGE
jgi:DNA polymerase elongation subunit (family B)